jgi:uncharacterized membrane protein
VRARFFVVSSDAKKIAGISWIFRSRLVDLGHKQKREGEKMKLTRKGRKVRDRIIMVIIALLILAHIHVFILVVATLSLVIGIYIGRQHSPKTVVKRASKSTNKKRA